MLARRELLDQADYSKFILCKILAKKKIVRKITIYCDKEQLKMKTDGKIRTIFISF